MKYMLLLCISGLMLTGCSHSDQPSPKEAWEHFCSTIPSASYNIMTDRQQGIEKDKSLEHAKKLQDPKAQKYIVSLIEEAYAIPLYTQMEKKEKAMDDFRKDRYEQCLKQ